MKAFIAPILTTLAVAQLLTVVSTKAQETPSVSQNKSNDALVGAMKVEGFPNDPNLDLDALLSKGPRVMPDLARLLQSEASTDERIKAVDAMGAIAYRNPSAPEVQATVPVLMKVAQQGDDAVRFRAVQALGAIGRGASNAVPVLIQLLTKDTNSGVRMCAVEALGRIKANSPESLAALTVAMNNDASGDVQFTATEVLYKIGRPATNAIPVLIQLTKNESVGVRCCAVQALGRVGTNSPEAVVALKLALKDESEQFVRPIAREALAKVGPQDK